MSIRATGWVAPVTPHRDRPAATSRTIVNRYTSPSNEFINVEDGAASSARTKPGGRASPAPPSLEDDGV